MANKYIILLFLSITFNVVSQNIYHIDRGEAPKIDGALDEVIWSKTESATDFITQYPKFGDTSEYVSDVHMFYDDDALYIAGRLFDLQPDSISYTLSQRDDTGNADWFGVSIDPYANNLTAFAFIVTAAGVEIDGLLFPSDEDMSWNAVWKSAVSKFQGGWAFEMRIPFSAIRFPNKDIQEWNINFSRQIRRNRKMSFWNPVDPNEFGEITQSGKLIGIENVKSPLRLSLTPYVTGYVENSYDYTLGKQTWKQRVNGGLDLKYGLNDAFTLDMTLIPDFGQTVSDQQVLNLGPFEVQFAENRPFFLEGTDLFSIGGVFYSRRIGATPYNYWDVQSQLNEGSGEQVISNPETASLLNGTKISGRTTSGLGVGLFNSLEGRAVATIEDSAGNRREIETHPLTNYNVFVLSQALKNNSNVSFVNTNVTRVGDSRDANVSLVEANIFSKDKKYLMSTSMNISSIFENGLTEFGHSMSARIDKVTGNWNYGVEYGEESDTYDPNDLGFLYANNSRWYQAELGWYSYIPKGMFLRKWSEFSIYYEELYSPQLYSGISIEGSYGGTFRNFLTAGLDAGIDPIGEVNHFESRQFGKEVRFGKSTWLGGFYSSDYSKQFALDLRISYKQFFQSAQKGVFFTVSPRVRLSDRMFMVWRSQLNFIVHDYGYVRAIDDSYSEDVILGYRDREIVENTLRAEFIFTNRMGVNIQFRHYWQQVDYKYFVELGDGGVQTESDYNPLENKESAHNTNYNAFTLDVNYRWVFIPGSELRIVYKNNIFNSQSDLAPSYLGTFDTLFDQPQVNSVSAKLLVYVDAIYFRRKHKGSRI
ncbi:MAG: carbohydrate binding family 9 domain-containing protein [Crocinitomicaceae bacterium]|nr:carbohydrate binding family 9 domain-containing protein [Crocinitomicaceae bacterium]